jgi:CRISPR type I-E-associated protein CasB/Cse2
MNTAALVGHLSTLAQADKGAKAAMRAALFPQLEYRTYPYIVKFVDLRNPVEVTVANVIAFGIASGLHVKDGGSLGAALRKMGAERESGTAERILNSLFSVHNRRTRAEIAARSIASLTDLNLRLDLEELGYDLLMFNLRTQRKWAADFYAAAEPSEEKAAAPA